MKKRKLLIAAVLLLLVAFVFAACRRDPADDPADGPGGHVPGQGPDLAAIPEDHPIQEMFRVLQDFPEFVDEGRAHVAGTTLELGVALASPWNGLIGGAIFHDDTTDAFLAGPLGTANSIFSMNDRFQFGHDGVATFEYNIEEMSITIHMTHEVYWHDGVPLTLDDLVFAYEVMAHPDYAGPRFSSNEQRVVGIMDFRAGYTDRIEGMVLSNNNRTLKIYFEAFSPTLFYFGFWTAPMPRHVFEGIAVADMPASDAVRGAGIIGWGPFMFEHIVAGEALTLVANPNYVFGAPHVERVHIQRTDPTLVPEHMHSGTFDVMAFSTAHFEDHMHPTAFRYLGSPSGNYDYFAFRLGRFLPEDPDNPYGAGVWVMEPERTMYRLGVELRRAMAYAIDPGFLGDEIFSGLRFGAAGNMTPNHISLIDFTVPGFPYDPDRAREILDNAGFLDLDGDGFRECPDGDPITLYWSVRSGSPVEDVFVPWFIGQWAEVGINVELWKGTTHGPLYIWSYTDYNLDMGDDEIMIFEGGWSVGANPNPVNSWGDTFWNASGFVTDGMRALFDRMDSPAAFDPDYLAQVFSEWQWYWYENVFMIPTFWAINLTAVNNRVDHWDTRFWNLGTNPNANWHNVRLAAPQPDGR